MTKWFNKLHSQLKLFFVLTLTLISNTFSREHTKPLIVLWFKFTNIHFYIVWNEIATMEKSEKKCRATIPVVIKQCFGNRNSSSAKGNSYKRCEDIAYFIIARLLRVFFYEQWISVSETFLHSNKNGCAILFFLSPHSSSYMYVICVKSIPNQHS